MAQLVEQSLLIPEVRGLNPVSGKISKLEKTKIKKNEPRNDQTKKKFHWQGTRGLVVIGRDS